MDSPIGRLRQRARRLKSEIHALYLAWRDPRVPWYAKVVVACVVGYALSPIDLIPDVIPVLGYLDDLILVPAGPALAIRLIPHEVMAECRDRAQAASRTGTPRSWITAVIILAVWVAVLAWIALAVLRYT